MGTSTPERHLRNFLDEVCGEAADADSLGVLGPLFAALRKQLSLSSGLFIRIDPSDWRVTVPYAYEIAPDVMRGYMEHYYRLDPFSAQLTNLKRPNEVVLLSDIVDVEHLIRGEFGEGMRLAGFFHAMAIVPFVRGVPLGAVAVHRPRHYPDFGPNERALFRWFVSHAARVMDYRHLVSRLSQPDPATMVVAPGERRVLALTEEARSLLHALPDGKVLSLPPDPQHACLWQFGGKTYAVRSVGLGPESVLNSAAIANLSFNTASALTDRTVRFSPVSSQHRALIMIEPVEGVDQVRGKLSGFGLTPRQEQVALLLVLGKGIKDIARTCEISLNTAKEYVADVYQRLDVHTRGAFVAKMTGSRVPGRTEPCGAIRRALRTTN